MKRNRPCINLNGKAEKTILLLKDTLLILYLNFVNQINWLNLLCMSDFNVFLHLHISQQLIVQHLPLPQNVGTSNWDRTFEVLFCIN